LGNGDYPGIVHFNGNRALEEGHRQHEATLPFEVQQDSLEPAKGSVFDSHSLTDSQERPRSARDPGSNSSLNGGNFGVVNGDRTFAYSDNRNNPGCRKNGEPVLQVEPAKDITGEERKLNFLNSVRPKAPGLIEREKPFIAFATEDCCDGILVATPDSEGKPGVTPVAGPHSHLCSE